MTSQKFIGQPIARIEDHALLTGAGRFVGDIYLPGMLEAAFVSELVRACRIKSIDTVGGAGDAWRACGPDL